MIGLALAILFVNLGVITRVMCKELLTKMKVNKKQKALKKIV